jgi:membrane protein
MSSTLVALVETSLERIERFFDGTESRRIVKSIFFGMRQHHAMRAASAMAFDLFLASSPMLAVGGWLFAQVLRSDIRAVGAVSSLIGIAPGQVFDLSYRQMDRLSGVALAPVVLLGALWLASSAFHTLLALFEQAFDTVQRPWWKKRLLAIACVIVGFIAVSLSGTVTVLLAGGPVAFLARLAGDQSDHLQGVGLLTAVLTLTLLTAGFFHIGVNRPGKRSVWPGTLVTVVIGVTSSVAFAEFVGHVARYTVFYGSLAAVAIFLVWLWIGCVALLLGAEVNARLTGLVRDGPK